MFCQSHASSDFDNFFPFSLKILTKAIIDQTKWILHNQNLKLGKNSFYRDNNWENKKF